MQTKTNTCAFVYTQILFFLQKNACMNPICTKEYLHEPHLFEQLLFWLITTNSIHYYNSWKNTCVNLICACKHLCWFHLHYWVFWVWIVYDCLCIYALYVIKCLWLCLLHLHFMYIFFEFDIMHYAVLWLFPFLPLHVLLLQYYTLNFALPIPFFPVLFCSKERGSPVTHSLSPHCYG